ncbi:MAG TPA: SPFH domain-containing protein [Thiotrichales bacterium]|jgi:regulator of protease activity HflC (stomatin/prohibitin superfamily)|nr:MAG: paraslipin [Thiotrichales bacterium 35-46-9]OYZ42631.1 MAG: paraslipin [Thiotrichales bacterium 24-47-4]HQR81721.1 SPFH domain-containing protein [Thiotrichales bacterium]HQR95018.1 SPFH domain-containing protein [Thiotrichales bacterium]
MEPTIFALFMLIAVAAVIIAKGIVIVPQQMAFVVERLGRYNGTLDAGLHIIIPMIDRIAYRHSLKEVPMDVAPQVCITRDNTQVQIDGILYYQVTDAKLASYGNENYSMAIESLAKTCLRSEVGKRELDKLLEDRQTINVAVVSALDEASITWGVKTLRYEIKDINPPHEVLASMQLQITAEREKRAAIARAEGEKQAAIAQSEGEKQAAINAATGEAEALRLVAEANADAIAKVAAATELAGGMQAVNLKVAEQYVQAFAQLAKTGNTIIVPANVSDISGMLASAMSVLNTVKK